MTVHGYNSSKTKDIMLKLPDEITGEVELVEFKNRKSAGTVLLCGEKAYRLVCREDSNTFLIKSEEGLSKIELCLECQDIKYGEEDILDILPEISMGTLGNVNLYMPKTRVFSMYPMTDIQYKNLLMRNRSLWAEHDGQVYFAKVANKTTIEVLLLARSLIISKETTSESEIRQAFNEILSPILFQLVVVYVDNESIDDVKLKSDIISLFKITSANEEEFRKNMTINALQ
ncbi:hypothetical protein NEIRO02_2316 [Nematocida sp. AWRm79]|nr:hypothetical protein NEIRO02_2316 [Nematocida sp. AWRm79]